MKLSLQIILALCLTYLMTTSIEAAIKKASYQELKKFIISEKSRVPSQELATPRKTSITGIPSIKMSYVDAADFRQVISTESPILVATTTKTHIPIFDLREESTANLKAFPHIENDRNSRFTTSIVFGIGGSTGFGF